MGETTVPSGRLSMLRGMRGGLGVRLSMLWLLLVAIVGVAAPLLAATETGWATPFGPFERPKVSGSNRLAPGSSSIHGLAPVIEPVLRDATANPADASGKLGAFVDSFRLPDNEAAHLVRALEWAVKRDASVGAVAQMMWLGGSPLARLHRLGTDSIGQDVLANVIHACRSALLVGIAGAGTALLIGITLGALMGYFGGWVDLLLMRIVEVFMSVPLLFLLVLGAAVLPREPIVIMGLIGAVTWTGVARLTRAEVMRVRAMDFVDAARASGLPAVRVIFNHVLPSALTPAFVEAAFLFAAAILFEATLSFLNLGPVDRASWGRLLAQATGDSGDFAWWLAVFPGVMIVLTVLSAQTLGAAGREARQSSRSIA